MATPSHAQAVKSLNKSAGRRRFVFKTFFQRIEEIEIDVFRSLDKIKSEPSEGSSFTRDCLMEWRELNMAEDFISLYEDLMPIVQTLPLVLLNKELIILKLMSRLKMEARLSLEPILRLIAALSRDLLEEFIIFIPRLVDSLVSLLKTGGDKEPEIVEQIFTSWSYILMYLQKYLVCDIVNVLKLTTKLRYYPKGYVQELVAVATSFLLRSASKKQLRKGARKIMLEVVKKPLPVRKYGVGALLYYVMRGTSSRFHSRAEQLLQILIDDSILSVGDRFDQGLDIVVEVAIIGFERLCEEYEPDELSLIWNCLYHKIDSCITNRCFLHLGCLLSMLVAMVRIKNGQKVSDYQPMLERVGFLVQTFITPSGVGREKEDTSEIIDHVLQLMLAILDGLISSNDTSAISLCSVPWSPIFELRSSSCSTFLHGLLAKDSYIVYTFRTNILGALNHLIDVSPEEGISLLLTLCERLQKDQLSFSFFDGTCDVLKIADFLQGALCSWVGLIQDIVICNEKSSPMEVSKLAMLWGIICCHPYVMVTQSNSSSLMDMIDALDQLLMIEGENIAGVPRSTWQSLIGATLRSYCKCGRSSGLEEMSKVLHLAKTYRLSSQVLSAVADYLDQVHGPTRKRDSRNGSYHPELDMKKASDAFGIFADNLFNPAKEIRVQTLRILCHYEPQVCEISTANQPPEKRLKTEASQTCYVDGCDGNWLQLLHLIETTPLSVSTSRKVILLISRIQMGLTAGRVAESYAPIILCGILGIFHNRFSYLWNAASECLAALINKHPTLVWDRFAYYLEQCLSVVHSSNCNYSAGNVELSCKSSDLVECFNSFVDVLSDSTPYATIVSLLLQSLQKIPSLAESCSRRIIPLFLKFLGYSGDSVVRSVGSFNSNACKGKDRQGILKEWLNLLKLMRNPKALYQSQFVKDVLQFRLIDDSDPELQMKVLDSLLPWKDEFLLPYEQDLRNLISSKRLREELTTWGLSKESGFIEEGHRANLVPLVLHILMPKVRTLKTLASRKHASVNHRKAVLQFIAQLDISEIPLFFALLMRPLHISNESDCASDFYWTVSKGSFDEFCSTNTLKNCTQEKLMALPWKKRYGFLHVIEEVVGTFDEVLIKPFLDLLMGIVVRILGSSTSGLEVAKGAATLLGETCCSSNLESCERDSEAAKNVLISRDVKQFKDLRSLCLKIISNILNKYEDHEFGCEFWDAFFASVRPLIDSIKQQASSSEKPSALLSCFLALSKSYHLVPLLSREKNLVPEIFSILTVATASEAIISCVLKFIENLLILDDELDHLDDENAVKNVLLANLNVVMSSLYHLFQRHIGSKRKLAKYAGGTLFRIFKLLSKYIKDPLLAGKLLDVLLHLLVARANDSDARVDCLQIVQHIIPVLGSDSTKKILNAVSELLITKALDIRMHICNILETLAKADPSVVFVAKLVCQLNATATWEVDGLDYDTINNAYRSINSDFFYTVEADHALVILSHCICDMSSEEIILRNNAYESLLSFVEFSARFLDETEHHSGSYGVISTNIESCWARTSIKSIIRKFLLKHIGNAIKAGSSVRKEWIELLKAMVLRLPEVSSLNSCKVLCSEDGEQDFFNNIVHLQKHRRARAVLRFKNVSSIISKDIIKRVFLPLFLKMLFDAQDGKDEHIRNSCLEAVSSISAHMDWKSYHELLKRCLQEMTMNVNRQKTFSRLICSILDQFHFSQMDNCREVNDCLDSLLGSEASVLAKQSITSAVVISSEIQACLSKTVLQKILKLLESDRDKVNVTLNLAALKVLKLLPEEIMDSQLPSIIHRIANNLKSRSDTSRDEARLALAACLKELGHEYLQFVVGVLRGILKRGYELHVLGYSLNFILSNMLRDCACMKLDYCLEDLLAVVENDILGDVAEEKEVEKIASKMKETRKLKSFETLEMIAQGITFKSHALKLLSPVTAHMQNNITPKLEKKLRKMLNHIAAGIECNPSIDETNLLIFIYGLVEDGTEEENALEGNSSAEANMCCHLDMGGKMTSSRRVVGSKSVCHHLISEFALCLFHKHIKKVRLDKNDEQIVSMLDPFVQLLGSCLNSKYEGILSAALGCLTLLVRLPLPSLPSQADKIKLTLLDTAQSSVNAKSPLMQSCLRLLTDLFQSTKITLSADHLRMLIQLPLFSDIERNPSFVALSLLRAIVKRKLVVPEIYDLVIRVAELMVTSQLEPIRRKCSQILLQFLLDYHLSESYLQQHLDFLLKNLSYEHSTGREAVLEMLHVIIKKFPRSFLDQHVQTLFIHLVKCLANDSDYRVRSMTGAVIKLLLGCASPNVIDSVFDFTLSWYMGGKQQLQSVGAQALGLLVEVMNRSFRKHIDVLLPVSKNILQSAIKNVTDGPLGDHLDDAVAFWKEAYYSLVMLEKILQHFQDICFHRDLEEIWQAICELLLHPHSWLRNISNRLIAFYFATATNAKRENDREMVFLLRPSRLFSISVSLCCQLKTLVLDDAFSILITQNLVFAIYAIHSLMARKELFDPEKFLATLEQHEQVDILKAFQLLDPKKGGSMYLYLFSGLRNHDGGDQYKDLRHFLISNLLRKMGQIALEMEAVQMKIVFTSYGEISSQMNQDDCLHYAFDMLLPLYKVSEGFSGKLIPDDLKQLAQEVSEGIRNTIGIPNFIQIYSKIQKDLKLKRDKRKQDKKVMAVVNPVRSAKRKLHVAAKHRAHKKRKIMTVKIGRWMR